MVFNWRIRLLGEGRLSFEAGDELLSGIDSAR